MTGWTAIVVPVRRGGERLALKVTWPHPEGTHEALVLRHWAGAAAVRLVAADPARGVMLLSSWTPPVTFARFPSMRPARRSGGLLARLNVPAPMQLIPMADYLAPHLDRMAHRPAIPRRIVDRTRGAGARSSGDPAFRTCCCTPIFTTRTSSLATTSGWRSTRNRSVGIPGFELLPSRTTGSTNLGSGRRLAHRRVIIAAEAAGIDLDEAFAWARAARRLEVSWATSLGDPAEVSRAITLQKALDD